MLVKFVQYIATVILAGSLFEQTGVVVQALEGCGGTVNSDLGNIQSPGYPSNYPLDKTCTWVITSSNKDDKIQLTFKALDLEDGGKICKYDYIIIRDGNSAAAPILGKFCGSSIPQIVWASSNQVYVKLFSDGAIVSKGFDLQYMALPSIEFPNFNTPKPTTLPNMSCGKKLDGLEGQITAPGYPDNYLSNKYCLWSIEAPTSSSQIELNIVFVDMEQHPSCQYDYLDIKSSSVASSTSLLKLCGVKESQKLYGKKFIIEFKSDNSTSKTGFQIEWRVIPNTRVKDLELPIFKGRKGCRMEQNGFVGIFSSQLYPDNYNSSLECEWIITSEPSTKIQLRFTDFDLEQSDSCEFDFLEIYDGFASNSQMLGRYCGREIPDLIESESNQLYLYFETDESDTRRGFEATWIALDQKVATKKSRRQVGNKCGGKLIEKTGAIESINYPLKYAPNSACDWVIKTDALHEIVLTFDSFDLERHSQCRYDFVKIRDGETRQSKLIGTYCGTNSPGTVKSTGDSLYVSFVSDSTTHRKGFRASWIMKRKSSITPSECGGALNGESGSVTSPGYPKPTIDRTICTWTINVPEGGKVRFEFVDIDITEHPGCAKGYVQLTNGKITGSHSNFGSFCGFVLPRPLVSESNIISVGFLSDSSLKSRGFQARWKTIYPEATKGPSVTNKETPCGEIFRVETGSIIRSTSVVNCSWVVIVPSGKMITVFVMDLVMADDPECRREQLEIRDGSNKSQPLLVRTCGQLKPRPVTSSSNRIFIQHTVFKKQVGSRLRLTWKLTTKGESSGVLNEASCGLSTAAAMSQRNGADQGVGTLPWVVAIMGMYGKVLCAGAILSPDWVLTAAHCFERLPWKVLWTIRAGEYNLRINETSEQEVGIRDMYIHPRYNSMTHDNDITLLRLNQPLILNDKVKTICLPSSEDSLIPGKVCSVAGWGARKFLGKPNQPLVHVLPKLVSKNKCNKASVYDGNVTDNMLCAGGQGVDSCQGDGGSPLTCAEQGRHYVQGIVSWGNGCAFPGKYGVYTDVRKYIDWLTSIIEL